MSIIQYNDLIYWLCWKERIKSSELYLPPEQSQTPYKYHVDRNYLFMRMKNNS
jgi:hypothetical protein